MTSHSLNLCKSQATEIPRPNRIPSYLLHVFRNNLRNFIIELKERKNCGENTIPNLPSRLWLWCCGIPAEYLAYIYLLFPGFFVRLCKFMFYALYVAVLLIILKLVQGGVLNEIIYIQKTKNNYFVEDEKSRIELELLIIISHCDDLLSQYDDNKRLHFP